VPIPGVVDDENLQAELEKISDREGEYVLDGIITREQAQAFFR
jgi:ribose transport system substrate-binding protein